MNLKYLALLGVVPLMLFGFDNVLAEESQNIQVEVKYNNGDRAIFTE